MIVHARRSPTNNNGESAKFVGLDLLERIRSGGIERHKLTPTLLIFTSLSAKTFYTSTDLPVTFPLQADMIARIFKNHLNKLARSCNYSGHP